MKVFLFWLCWFNFLMLLCPAKAWAYLDPGTGSMLLSALVGLSATAFFMAKNIWEKLVNVFFRLTGTNPPDTGGHGMVFYSEGAQYWSTFKPVLEALDKSPAEILKNKPVLYLSSGKNDPGLSHPFKNVEARYIGEGSRAFAVLGMLEADLCVLTTPGLDVLQIKRSPGVKHFAHLVHAVTDMSTYKLYSFDWYDSILCSGKHQMKSLRYLEKLRGTPKKKLLPTGCPYLDVMDEAFKEARTKNLDKKDDDLAKPNKAIGKNDSAIDQTNKAKVGAGKKTVLIAPTWGPNGLLRKFGSDIAKGLAEEDFKVLIRPHPQSFTSEKELMDKIKKELERYPQISWDRAPSGQKAMLESDILVSDLSGIVFDYAFGLEKPVITVSFDLDLRGYDGNDLPWQPWEVDILPKLGGQLKAGELDKLPALVNSLLGDSSFTDKIRSLRDESVYNYANTGAIAADQLMEILKEMAD